MRCVALALLAAKLAIALRAPSARRASPTDLRLRAVEEPGAPESTLVAESVSSPELELTPTEVENNRLRAAEKFIRKETGTHICRTCNYKYEPEAMGQPFSDLPISWRCPTCRSSKTSFEAVVVVIAGFEENLNYGLGYNNMSEGNKNILIFGGLAGFFALFMSGYLLT
ncbi:hypothetical protein M885DRAFT_506938 [Pelagophyceae sp. CCMP2097]|nr:hypothetical protein M885DRAFT_506938 [Pelagophyceae sp. CCMP2097]|mmetsp:Transcript_30939/g.104196  ORF Transcript_30939/g.104196 Transcript_30939/m.104196 type:complete len:169 (+) Transcript_30939:39-545(+)